MFHLWYVDACPRTQKTREFMYALSIQQKAGIMRCSRFHSKSSNPSNPCYLIHLKPRCRKTRTSHGNVMFYIEPIINFRYKIMVWSYAEYSNIFIWVDKRLIKRLFDIIKLVEKSSFYCMNRATLLLASKTFYVFEWKP